MVLELLLDLARRQICRATEIERRWCDLKHRTEALGGSLKVAPQGGECLLVEQLFAAWGVAIVALTVALSPMVYGDSAN